MPQWSTALAAEILGRLRVLTERVIVELTGVADGSIEEFLSFVRSGHFTSFMYVGVSLVERVGENVGVHVG